MSAPESDAISLRSLVASRPDSILVTGRSTAQSVERGTYPSQESSSGLSGNPDGRASPDSPDSPPVTALDGYVDGGYGWIVTAGSSITILVG
jgi:hypothetical protein